MKTFVLNIAFSLLVAVLAFTPIVAHAADSPPNIVIVLFDDMDYGQPKCYREDKK